jgi:NDP-sugar pyrophosphorylase family protein
VEDHRSQVEDLAGVVLAAGLGTRFRPLTGLLPKALCPVANVPLVDLALERPRAVVGVDGGVIRPES